MKEIKTMTKDWMNRLSKNDYTAFDIGYAAFKRGEQKKLKKMIKRKVRRTSKMALDKQFGM
jgi:hypothetical protein